MAQDRSQPLDVPPGEPAPARGLAAISTRLAVSLDAAVARSMVRSSRLGRDLTIKQRRHAWKAGIASSAAVDRQFAARGEGRAAGRATCRRRLSLAGGCPIMMADAEPAAGAAANVRQADRPPRNNLRSASHDCLRFFCPGRLFLAGAGAASWPPAVKPLGRRLWLVWGSRTLSGSAVGQAIVRR